MSNGPGGTSNVTGYIRFKVAANAAAGTLSSTFELLRHRRHHRRLRVRRRHGDDLGRSRRPVTMTAPAPNKVVPGRTSVSYTDRTHQQRSVGRGGGVARRSRRRPVSAPRPTAGTALRPPATWGRSPPSRARNVTVTFAGSGQLPPGHGHVAGRLHRHGELDDRRPRRGQRPPTRSRRRSSRRSISRSCCRAPPPA